MIMTPYSAYTSAYSNPYAYSGYAYGYTGNYSSPASYASYAAPQQSYAPSYSTPAQSYYTASYYSYPSSYSYPAYASYYTQQAQKAPAAQSIAKTQAVKAVKSAGEKPVPWVNNLKPMFHNRQAITYALHIRTFAATDKNSDGKISYGLGESGTFLKAIPKLKELKALGVNNIHLLPINPVGKTDRLGELGSPGSVYSPAAYDRLNEEYDEPGNKMTVEEEAKKFVDEAHKLGIHVMVDIPSCASIDLGNERPDLLVRDGQGKPLTPTNWIDIRMFVKDSKELREYYQKYFDLMDRIGVDGFRADIARARTMNFWKYFINQYPNKAWLAETYTEEDASPMKNIPRDVPEDLLKAGFDSIYGQFHIFHDMDANQYTQYLQQNQSLFNRVGREKTSIGSFLTHDDPPTMDQGKALYCQLISGLMMTQPDTNPYILDGFTTGYDKHFDIFNFGPRPEGKHPEIGNFMQKMIALRQNKVYGPALTVGKFIPLRVEQNQRDPRVIAFLRQFGDKTLLIVANKDVNAAHEAKIEIPGLNPRQTLQNLASHTGGRSTFVVDAGHIQATLAPGAFTVSEVLLPRM